MFSSNLVTRAPLLVGLVVALSLPRTARAQSVSPQQALLNRMPAITSQAPAATHFAVSAVPGVMDGERALLNRSHTIIVQPVASARPFIAEASVDGVKALLNRSSS